MGVTIRADQDSEACLLFITVLLENSTAPSHVLTAAPFDFPEYVAAFALELPLFLFLYTYTCVCTHTHRHTCVFVQYPLPFK